MDTVEAKGRADVHTRITDEIIQAIEAGAPDCVMPWHRQSGAGLPRNPVTGKTYRGTNTLALWARSCVQGYGLPFWATYRQWKSLGAQVRQGEHGTPIVFYMKSDAPDEIKGDVYEDSPRAQFVLCFSTVFNAEQVLNWRAPNHIPLSDDDTFAKVESFIKGLGADIRYGSDTAYYNPSHDRIYMPSWESFRDTSAGCAAEGFYAVLLHEHVHWSGAKSRLNRDLSGRFGTNAYAVEELIAELGAAFLAATFGVSTTPRPDHASYIDSWLHVLGRQKSAILVAASVASRAAQYLEICASSLTEDA